MSEQAIGIIGGSGLYRFFAHQETVNVSTPYGDPSAPIQMGTLAGRKAYFIARHGVDHEIPPHKVNYRANMAALHQLGVRQVIATHALGSLNPDLKPGDFVLAHQFVNTTWGRADTFFDGPETVHISASDPFCKNVRRHLREALEALGHTCHTEAVMLVIQGPRFNTRAENLLYYRGGNDVISMTGYPEAVLARELGICYASLGIVTDLACVLNSPNHPETPASHADVVETFAASIAKVSGVLEAVAAHLDLQHAPCSCAGSLEGAKS